MCLCLAISEIEGKGGEVRTRLRKVFKTMQKGDLKEASPMIYYGIELLTVTQS